MRTTLALDDELVAKAQAFTGLKEKSSLVREALKALIERESARRLARLGGEPAQPETAARRRQPRRDSGRHRPSGSTTCAGATRRSLRCSMPEWFWPTRLLSANLPWADLRQREIVLKTMSDLPHACLATDADVLLLIDRHALLRAR